LILQKSTLVHALLKNYEKEVEPPLSQGPSNTTVKFGMSVACAESFGISVQLETWISLV